MGGYAMRAAQARRTLATFNSLWDGRQIRLDRQKAEIILRDRRLAMHIMMQPPVAAGLLADPLAESIGFLPRCLIVEPASTIGQRRIVAPSASDLETLRVFQERLQSLLSEPLPIADPETRELAPRRLPLSDEARAYLVKYADAIEVAQAPGHRYENLTAFASKTVENACRIAGALTVWHDINAENVKQEEMESGLKLAFFYLNEAARLMSRLSADADLRMADDLRVWLLARQKRTFVLGDILQRGPAPMRKKNIAKRLLIILESHGWVQRLPDGAVIGGQARRSAWTLCESC